MVMQTQQHGEDFRLEGFYCALLLCSCSELLRKLQKKISIAWQCGGAWKWNELLVSLGQFREHRLWNALLKTKLHSCLHPPLFWVPENSIDLLKGTKEKSEFTELPAAPSYLYNYYALFIKGCLISPQHLWFEVQSFMFDLKQQQFTFFANTKGCYSFIGFLRSPKY